MKNLSSFNEFMNKKNELSTEKARLSDEISTNASIVVFADKRIVLRDMTISYLEYLHSVIKGKANLLRKVKNARRWLIYTENCNNLEHIYNLKIKEQKTAIRLAKILSILDNFSSDIKVKYTLDKKEKEHKISIEEFNATEL